MAIRIESENGRVLVQATDGSHVSNIVVAGRTIVGKRRLTRHQKLQLIFVGVMGACMLIFVLMILGVKV